MRTFVVEGCGKLALTCGTLFACWALPVLVEGATEETRERIASPLRMATVQDENLITRMTLDPADYARVQSGTTDRVLVTDFAVTRDRRLDLDLRRVEIFSEGAEIVLGSAQGDVSIAKPDVVLLTGQVAGHPDSHVFLGLSPHGSNGIIRVGGETFVVSSGRHARAANALVYSLSSLPAGAITWRDFHCAVDELVGEGSLPVDLEPSTSSLGGPRDGVLWVIDMAIETDWEFTGSLFGGDTDASGAYATMLVGAASEIYMRDLGAQLVISYLRLWSNSSDPWSSGDTSSQLSQFRSYWQSNMGSVQRDLAHMLSGRSLGGGIAWVGVICSSSIGYAVSANIDGFFPYPLQDNHSQNWDIMVFAHETGHNFNAPHTHNMNPQIDGCAYGDCSVAPNGTIMSYCHQCSGGLSNIVLNFHERIINERILPYLSNHWCAIAAGPPAIYQDPPDTTACLGGIAELTVIASGSAPLTIQWRKDGIEIPGATGGILIIDPVEVGDAGSYDVVVSNDLGSVTSGAGALTTAECSAPDASIAGGRYLGITPQPPGSGANVALQVSIPGYLCIPPRYVGADGALVESAIFQSGPAWGTVFVFDHDIVPQTAFSVRTDFGTLGSPRLSEPVVGTTSTWGDIVGEYVEPNWTPADGVTDFIDISASVACFRNLPTAPPRTWCDIYPAYPDDVIDFSDIAATVDGFRGRPYPFEGPQCP